MNLTLVMFLRFQRPDLHRVDRDDSKDKKNPATESSASLDASTSTDIGQSPA